jgi:hypothetical protein
MFGWTKTPHNEVQELCKQDPTYVFPEMKLSGLFPNVHIHVSVNVEIRNEAAQFPFWNYYFELLIQCVCGVVQASERECHSLFCSQVQN